MLITVNKQETIELVTPHFMKEKHYNRYYHITEHGDLTELTPHSIRLYDRSDPGTARRITDAYNSCHSCTESEYREVRDKFLFKVEEKETA